MLSELCRSMANHEVPHMPSATVCSFSLKEFHNPVSFKLDDENFLAWEHQVLATIRARKLQKHLVQEKVPKRFNSEQEEEDEIESQAFSEWGQQDQHLVTWLLASMSPAFTNRVVGCDRMHQIWANIKKYFASQTKARIKNLKVQLKVVKKEESIPEYLLKEKKIVDSLVVAGCSVSTEEHVAVILDGLGDEYNRI